MDIATLSVETRSARGSRQTRVLRSTGMIPVVLYGGDEAPLHLQARYYDVKRHLSAQLRVYKLQVGAQEQPGFLKDVQWDCLTDEPLHLDFFRIDMEKPLLLEIEILTIGHPKGAASGGVLVQDMKRIRLSCQPRSVPKVIEVKVADLEAGGEIRAKDLVLPEGCSIDVPEDAIIVHVTAGS